MRYYGFKAKNIQDGRQEIIVFNNNFHGRTISAVSFSSSKKYKEGFGPLTPGFVSVEFGNLEAVEKAITPTCGILVEPFQGEGGMKIPPKGFLKGLRDLSDTNDLLLVCDEIQVGMGRTGKKFCFEHENIVPDGVILGKALSGGLVPLSVFITNAKLMDRAVRIISEQCDLSRPEAQGLLEKADGRVKLALVMARRNVDGRAAQQLLDEHGQQLRPIIGPPKDTRD